VAVVHAHRQALEVRQATFCVTDQVPAVQGPDDQTTIGKEATDKSILTTVAIRLTGRTLIQLDADRAESRRRTEQLIDEVVPRGGRVFARISVRIPRTCQVSGQVFGPDTQIQIGDGDGRAAPM
jgi:hypothetical protein